MPLHVLCCMLSLRWSLTDIFTYFNTAQCPMESTHTQTHTHTRTHTQHHTHEHTHTHTTTHTNTHPPTHTHTDKRQTHSFDETDSKMTYAVLMQTQTEAES